MTTTDPNSDYNTASTDLFQQLPEPYQSDTNRAVFSNLFNRFLSKTETEHVVGYIGQGNPGAVVSRQIREPTVHRQAYQLQPTLYEKIGSVEHINSWYDILNGLSAQGVDVSRLATWGKALEFNWVPPIDINKIVNYRDYYWYDPDNPQSQPQYITVKSECAYAMALVSFYNSLISENGATFNIIGVIPADTSLVIQGNFLTLFSPDFIFYIENSPNVDLNNSFQQVVSSSYNSSLDQTTIVIANSFSNTSIGGDISLEQQLSIYEGIANCKCTGQVGWDVLGWDDNQPNTPPPIWNAAVITDISYPTLTGWNSAHPSPQQYDIWWDTTADILYSLQDQSDPTNLASWKAVYYNFSLIEQQTIGAGYWDLTSGCADTATIAGLNQWISQNKWVHKADVPNFSIAKQAQVPIIEFEPNLELSEWIHTTYSWKYRANTQLVFASTPIQPTRIELEPLNIYTNTTSTITFDERFGDLTTVFVSGYKFLISGVASEFTVQDSVFQRTSTPYGAFQTVITVVELLPGSLVPATNYVYPSQTSLGDPFLQYGDQWLFDGINSTSAVNHQLLNNMMTPTIAGPIYPSYTTNFAPYGEQFNITGAGVTVLNFDVYVPSGSTRALTERALVGFNDARVYVNGIRQYGNYDELGTTYVTGIQFYTALSVLDTVLVQVGEASYQDFGNYSVAVRTIEDNTDFTSIGPQLVSLIGYRLNEQVKTAVNQYPLFDIYTTDSASAQLANPIFGYYEAPDGVLYPYIGQRIVQAPDGTLTFQNFLVESNNGVLYAYRNYNLSANLYWYNTNTNQVLVWTGETWATNYDTYTVISSSATTSYLTQPVIVDSLPASPPFDGYIVFNTEDNTLYGWNIDPSVQSGWTHVSGGWWTHTVYIATSDQTLETNWRHGLNNEEYIPAQVDWQRRTFAEYTQQQDTYVVTTSSELIAADPSLTQAQADVLANDQWVALQNRSINPEWYTDQTTPQPVTNGPVWIGNWEIPDPLYYNVDHEDWQYITQTDLLTHFTTIVDAQPSYPGFGGQASANWRLIDYTLINWGLGGTIKEYDNSFDTFLSSQITNTVTPPSLFEFAQSEYENIITILRDIYTRNLVTYMTDTDTSVVIDTGSYAADQVLTQYEENEAANLVYGDSTTFTQGTLTTPSSGIRNWIATLPFFGIIAKHKPYIVSDSTLGIDEVIHHDGHRATYTISSSIISGLQQTIVNTPDPRATGEKFGRIRTVQPPISQPAFISQFSSVLRNDVYWLVGPTLYRLQVAQVGQTPPTITVPVGSLWWDTTATGTLMQQTSPNVWVPADTGINPSGSLYNGGSVETSSVSAWQIVDINQFFLDVILNAETLLWEEVPPAPIIPPLDFAAIEAEDPTLWDQYEQQQFKNYTIERQIALPYANIQYNPLNPFTWNYKYSTITVPPRTGTIDSGGCWQDVYEKAYGTPYPHLEPWVIQGYTDKPSWWDTKFLVGTSLDQQVFGLRRWKYVHDLPVVNAAPNLIFFTGDVTNVFADFDTFTVFYTDNVNSDVFTINSVSYSVGITTVNVVESTASVTTGSLASVGMWDYVLRGATPAGETPPLTPPLSYSYLSVNISGNTFADGSNIFNPDDVFPPYWDSPLHYPPVVAEINASIRSIFDSTANILLENADYLWMDAGPDEWQWRQTTNYLYSQVTVAYLMEPVRTIQSIFGTKFNYIDELPVDSSSGEVFSHSNTQFQGEITLTDQVIQVNGINQWYINFNRAAGFDASYSDFRALWTAWTAPLSYQFGSFIDTSSLSVDHRIVDLTAEDYEITMKRSPGVLNYWIDSFKVRITNVPPNYSLYDTQNEWRFELEAEAPVARTISYYGVKLYDFYVDPATSICYLYTYPVVGVSLVQNAFSIEGDVSEVLGGVNGAAQISVTGSNAGTYTITSSTFDPVTKQTTVVVTEPIPTSVVSSLVTAVNYHKLPWNSGDIVSVATTGLLPLPLQNDLQYFIIKLSDTSFQFAYTSTDVIANLPILFTTPAIGIQRVGQLYNTFRALGGSRADTNWSHYDVDTSVVNQLTLPATISGVQNLINIIDGYSQYTTDQGFGINLSGAYTDPATNQNVSWQNEIERFIDWAYQQRSVRRTRMNDKYEVEVNYLTGKFTFMSQNPGWLTGSQIVVWSFGGGLPPPLLIGQTYYVINNADGTVSLASNLTNARAGIAITINYIGGVGKLYLASAELYAAELPTYEINPFRNALWFSPTFGIMSNVIAGPYEDVYSTQLIFDQYGRRLSASDIRVFRQDKLTQIQFAGGVYNDVDILQNYQYNPYQYLHIGGANLYVDTYEHLLKFNDYTTKGALIYQPFLGLNVTKWELDFYKSTQFTERPNVGGYFLSQTYNQGANENRNIEGSVEDLRYMYDPYAIPETLPSVARTRSLLGYTGTKEYLSQINLTAKSQFLFWKGMIHNKGSLNCITAFVNSRRFINAKVDEFWAYKIADFGPTQIPEYLSMLLTTTDTQTNELRLEFILADQICLPGYAEETFGNTECGYAYPPDFATSATGVETGFTAISMTNEDRWYQQPNQLEQLVPDGGVLYFNLKPKQKLVIYPLTLVVSGFNPLKPSTYSQLPFTLTNEVGVIAYDPSTLLSPTIPEQQHLYTSWVFNGTTFNYAGGWDPPTTNPIFRHNFKADTVTLTMQWYSDGTRTVYNVPSVPVTTQLDLTLPYVPLTGSLSVFKGTVVDAQGNLINGVLLQPGIDYVESLEPYMSSNVLGYKLYFSDAISGSTIEVVYGPSQLNQDTQFQIVNTNIFNLSSQELVDQLFANDTTLTIWGLEADKETQNPAKIIDEESQTVLSPVTFWDPARGYFYYEALNTIDLQNDIDPAQYDAINGGLSGWKSNYVGVTWLDTTNVDYLPYYDTLVFPSTDERLADWGQLTDYGSVHAYQWTQSSVPPSGYNQIAAEQEGDNTIPAEIRYSGTVREIVQYRDRLYTTATVAPTTQGTATFFIGSQPIVETDPTAILGPIASLTSSNEGIGYVDGVYYNVPLTGGTGSSAQATLEVTNGSVTSIVVTAAGTGYYNGDVLSASNSYLGGTGDGFTSVVTLEDATFTITIDGTFIRTLTYPISEITTFSDLITILGNQFASYDATIALVNNTIVIASNTLGASSSVSISADTLFHAMANYGSYLSTPGVDQVITASDPTGFSVGSTVLFSSTNALPTGLVSSVVYTISSIVTTPGPTYGQLTLTGIVITTTGSGVLTMGSSVWPTQWISDEQVSVDLDASIDATVDITGTIFTFAEATTQLSGETVNIYVNGISVQTGYTITGDLIFPTTNVFPSINACDRITLIVPIYTPTQTDLDFNPDTADDGSVQVQWQYTTPYVTTQQFDTQTNQVTNTYYFWVENKTTSSNGRESISEAVADIIAPPAPYMFFGNLLPPALTVNIETEETIQLPFRFSQAIIRGLRGYVDVDNRYVLRFTRDFSLRDNLAFGTSPLQLKDAHQEWFMFREQQLSNVPVDLWNKITEAMAGYLLNNPSTRVPSLSRELYDASYGTSTQYGLGIGQAFVNGQTAITTVLAYLTDPANNFYPVDMDDFFNTYNFNTPADCIATMNEIYITFSYIHVNAIYFSVLQDALSVQKEYAGLMKTSAIALYGIELLDVAGAFDD